MVPAEQLLPEFIAVVIKSGPFDHCVFFQAGFLRKTPSPLSGILFLLYSHMLARYSRPDFCNRFDS